MGCSRTGLKPGVNEIEDLQGKAAMKLLLRLLYRFDPNNEAQPLALVFAGDLPTPGSRNVDANQHRRRRAGKGVRRSHC